MGNPFKKDRRLKKDDEFEIVGELPDGMPVASDGDYFYITDGHKILSDGYDRIDSLGYQRYVGHRDDFATQISLPIERINHATKEKVRSNHEIA